MAADIISQKTPNTAHLTNWGPGWSLVLFMPYSISGDTANYGVAVGRASCQAVVSTHPPTGYASSGLIISRWTHERKCRPRASCRSYHHWPAVEVVAGGTPASRRTTARCRRSRRRSRIGPPPGCVSARFERMSPDHQAAAATFVREPDYECVPA